MFFHSIDIHHKNKMRMPKSVLACVWANKPNERQLHIQQKTVLKVTAKIFWTLYINGFKRERQHSDHVNDKPSIQSDLECF